MEIFWFILVGFLAQTVDGALGMAYGVSSTTFLLSLGISPVAASASVHTAEMLTTAVSGLSHWKFKNIDFGVFKRLLIPGMLGGILGAYILSNVPGDLIKPWVTVYLLATGLFIILKAHRNHHVETEVSGQKLISLGLAGGFMDAIGGGGWGPIVTSTLVAHGKNPRYTVGSVNAAEFFVTVAQSATFFLTIGIVHWQIILGLMTGGVIAAPFAAYLCTKIPRRSFMIAVGILITVLSIRTLYKLF